MEDEENDGTLRGYLSTLDMVNVTYLPTAVL